MIKAVLFDFDGTIADTFQIVLNGVNEVLKESKYQEIEDPQALRDYSAFEVLSKVKVPIWKLPFIQRKVLSRIANEMQAAKTFSGMPALLAQLRMQYVVGVVTSNGQDSVDTILRKSKITLDLLHTQSSIFGKGKVIARACKEHELDPSEVIYVGDEIRDIEAARKAGCKVVSVTWGYNTKRSLKAANPDAIVDTPLQLASVIKKLAKN